MQEDVQLPDPLCKNKIKQSLFKFGRRKGIMKMVWEAGGRCTDVPFCISLTFRSKLKARISQNQRNE